MEKRKHWNWVHGGWNKGNVKCVCELDQDLLSPLLCARFFMYMFMVSGLCILMFIVHYVYTTVWRVSES